MVDGFPFTFASTTIDVDVQLCDGNSYSGPPPSLKIKKVEIRALASSDPGGHILILRPVFGGITDGDDYQFNLSYYPEYSQWFDITNDSAGPGAKNWTWSDIENLDCDVEAKNSGVSAQFIAFCSIVEIRVTS